MISRWVDKEKLRKQLEDCNFEMASTLISNKFSDAIIPKEWAGYIHAFISHPCPSTAISLIECDPQFLAFFEQQYKILLEEQIQELERKLRNLEERLIQVQNREKAIIRNTAGDLVKVGRLVNDLLSAVERGKETAIEQATEALRKWLDKYGI